MRRPTPNAACPQPDAIALTGVTWLACGIVLFGLTPLPLHDAGAGWSLAYWLLVAPIVLLLARRWAIAPAGRKALRARAARVPAFRRRDVPRHARPPTPAVRRPRRMGAHRGPGGRR